MLLSIRRFLFFSLVLFSSCHVGRFFIFNFADVRDHKKFPSRPLIHEGEPFHFFTAAEGKFPKSIDDSGVEMTFDDYLEKNETLAFMIIRNDTIQCEKYFDGYKASSIVPSFSMAKSFTSILIGCAIDDGLIQSVDEPMINYLPELKDHGMEKVTIQHLLQMTSGIDFRENYMSPFADVARFYYGRNLRRYIGQMHQLTEPGIDFEYLSGNTELLGLILERALKTKTVTDYFQEKIWTPLGMEYDASWSIDKKKNGLEKTFCCVNARARDYAKIGRLYLNEGNWNGKQIVSESWVKKSTHADHDAGGAPYYQYQWWIPSKKEFMAVGFLGQYIYVNPEKNLIIVRLGKKKGEINWWKFLPQIAAQY